MNAQRYGRLGLSLASALISATLAPAAFAQPSSADAGQAGPRLYRVEVIVFARSQADPGEEAFEHIARRQAAGDSSGADRIDVFDFGPYIPEEDAVGEPIGESSPRSRLVLGRDDAPERVVSPPAPAAPAGSSDAAAGSSATGSADGSFPDSATEAAGGNAAGAGIAADPFGGPGNAVAPFRFRLLQQGELELGDIRRRLERAAGYTPLVHGGWIQEGLPPQEARPFDLAYLGVSTPSGTIRLHVSRFLHLTLDLDYRPLAARDTAATDLPGNSVDDDAVGDDRPGSFGPVRPGAFGPVRPPLAEVDTVRRYSLDAERRMRSGEVHYFDHPFFGVIAVVEPYEPPEAPQTDGVRPAA